MQLSAARNKYDYKQNLCECALYALGLLFCWFCITHYTIARFAGCKGVECALYGAASGAHHAIERFILAFQQIHQTSPLDSHYQ